MRRQRRAAKGRLAVLAAALCLASASAALMPATTSAAAGQNGGTVSQTSAQGGYTARISRTQYGFPHILARDYDGLGYGYGYAFAQDNACELADQVATVRGERSRFFGPDGKTVDGSSNLASDTYYQGQRSAGTVRRLLDRKAPLGPTDEVRRMVDGYAAGYNRYLRDTGADELPDPRCKGRPWARPITALDLWDIVYDFARVTGTAPLAADIGDAKPPTAGVKGAVPAGKGTVAAPAPDGLPGVRRPARDSLPGVRGPARDSLPGVRGPARDSLPGVRGPARDSLPGVRGAAGQGFGRHAPSGRSPAAAADFGSNGWALGRDATRSGNAMVLANPHLPWTGGNLRFYQVQLTIPGTLDVSGAGLYGTPMVLIGHNRDLAWTHTASSAQHASFYRLDLAPGDPTSYVVDGRTERMERRTVPVTVRAENGELSTVRRTLYSSRYGPVVSAGWSTEAAYALRDANADNLRSMNTWLAMGRSRSLGELRAAQNTYQGMPWTYTLAADTGGSAYFTDSSVVPRLTDEQIEECLRPGGEEGPAALDGSTSGCDWGSDADALVPGINGPSRAPRLTRTDYVANSNNGPQFTNPHAPLTGFPGTYDTDPQLGERPQLGLRMIAERLEGTDGLGAPGFTAGNLRASILGNRVLTAETGRADVVGMCRAHPRPTATDGEQMDVTKACATLAGWDARADTRSRGAALWTTFYDHLVRSGPSATWQRVPYDPAQPLTTPRGIKGDDVRVRRALADAVQEFAARGVPVDSALGDLQKWAGVPLHGCNGNKGCFNVLRAGPDSGTGAPPAEAFGTSFLLAVELTSQGPRTRTLLTYGQSSNPASPHYTDQTRLYSRKQWVVERFTAAEIAADPALEVTTLHR